MLPMATIMDFHRFNGIDGFLERQMDSCQSKGNVLTYWKANAGLSSKSSANSANSANDLQASCTLSNPKSALQFAVPAFFASKITLKGEITESYFKSLEGNIPVSRISC